MTDTADASRRDDARALQARLYREIGVAAVAAALLPPAPPEAGREPARTLDRAGVPAAPRRAA